MNGNIDVDIISREKIKNILGDLNAKIFEIDSFQSKLNTPRSSRKRRKRTHYSDYTEEHIKPSSTSKSRRTRSSLPDTPPVKESSTPRRARLRRKPNQPVHPSVEKALEYGLEVIQRIRDDPNAYAFLIPVDPVALRISDYFDVVKDPMDLGTVKDRLESKFYANVEDFIEDVRLVWGNAMLYNTAGSYVHESAKTLGKEFEKSVPKIRKIGSKSTEEVINSLNKQVKEYTEEIKRTEEEIEAIKNQIPEDAVLPVEVKPLKDSSRNYTDMPYETRLELSNKINEINPEYYSGLISILEQDMPELLEDDPEELDIDINCLDVYILWRFKDYLDNYITQQVMNGVAKEMEDRGLYDSSSDSDSSDSDSDSDSDSSMDNE